ncbi:gamma-glutamyl-gamma-aminobutyrate hydrolase [Oceanisphaera marina]|uniref:Gamma-glutamyl-gamma-aminobutyrate hydrolase n=1 Tax=Oceanisphaera marina TaxID=2017550 RepID=A0ABQ1ICB3_9GAMM|nr:gamma-glutamyl-gamma-aminobutyrate hydrolase [Oceanisphaera marina]GGB32832.1 gamma-glutamyl-gamma-aminobutyrate hydrolase [Oceanisphaera marina]
MVDIINRPVVGIIMCEQVLGAHPTMTLHQKYLNAVWDAGGLPFPLVHRLAKDASVLRQTLSLLDGILLTGSPSNIEPHHYGAHGNEPNADPGRDALSLALVTLIRECQLPLLGICRGFQEMVVASGGSLYPRLHETGLFDEHREDESQPIDRQYGPAHSITPTENGVLSQLAGSQELWVNSLHTQGAHLLGAGVRTDAIAADGLVEAISFAEHPFALGVQWHPEWQSRENPLSRALFDGFIQACCHYQQQKGML